MISKKVVASTLDSTTRLASVPADGPATITSAHYQALMRPKNITVIGCSSNQADTIRLPISNAAIRALVQSGYQGAIFGTNPREPFKILGTKITTMQSVVKIPSDTLDLVIIVVPQHRVTGALADLIDSGKAVRNVLVISAGFGEVGNHTEQAELVAMARRAGMNLYGPNVAGAIGPGYNASFIANRLMRDQAHSGSMAFIAQSGSQALTWANALREGDLLHSIIMTGNQADVQAFDLLPHLAQDSTVKQIGLYVEGAKPDDPALLAKVKAATRKNPVIMFTPKVTAQTQEAAQSHTGSLAGDAKVFEAVMRQCGVEIVRSTEDLLKRMRFLQLWDSLKGTENPVGPVHILTIGGGTGIEIATLSTPQGLEIPKPDEQLIAKLKKILPAIASIGNPTDTTGSVTKEQFLAAGTTLLESVTSGSTVVFNLMELANLPEEDVTDTFKSLQERAAELCKNAIFVYQGSETDKVITDLRNKGLFTYSAEYLADLAAGLGVLARYQDYRAHIADPQLRTVVHNIQQIQGIVSEAASAGAASLSTEQGIQIMKLAGIITPQSEIATTVEEAVLQAKQIEYPVVMKIVSPDILHKSDADAVRLNLGDETAVRQAYMEIRENSERYLYKAGISNIDDHITGIEVTKMIKKPEGTEFIIGAKRDPVFGPVVLFGVGGFLTEATDDCTLRSFSLTESELEGMIQDIRMKALLGKYRGRLPRDIDAIKHAITTLGAIMTACPQISELEINPFVAGGVKPAEVEPSRALDIRCILKTSDRITFRYPSTF